MNKPQHLDNLKMHVFENIRHLPVSPSVQMQELPPRDMILTAMRDKSGPPSLSRQFLRKLEAPEDQQEDDEA
jgi:hypothetical protein